MTLYLTILSLLVCYESAATEYHWPPPQKKMQEVVKTVTKYEWRSYNKKVLLYFTAKWCGPCQKLSPEVYKLEKSGWYVKTKSVDSLHDTELTQSHVIVIDVDVCPNLAAKYGVRDFPMFVQLDTFGKEAERVIPSGWDVMKVAEFFNKRRDK